MKSLVTLKLILASAFLAGLALDGGGVALCHAGRSGNPTNYQA